MSEQGGVGASGAGNMRVAVFGPSGMLGRQVVKQLGSQAVPIYRRMVDITNKDSVARAVESCDAAINCAGVIPLKTNNVLDMIYVNSIFPHVLASCGIYTVLVSTDCVFSGRIKDRYRISHIPDPRDYYGRSKAMGEVMSNNNCIVRSSFIGCDHGFLYWVLSKGFIAKSTGVTQRLDGWKNALWTGSTVNEVAMWLVKLATEEQPVGAVHLATDTIISKHDLVLKIIETYELDVQVEPSYTPILNRALEPTYTMRRLDEALADYKCANSQVAVLA